MNHTPLNTDKLNKSKKKKINLKLILPIVVLMVVFGGILGGIALQNQKKVYQSKAAPQGLKCVGSSLVCDTADDCLIFKATNNDTCIERIDGQNFASQRYSCEEVTDCNGISQCSGPYESFNQNSICFSDFECGSEQIDAYGFNSPEDEGNCWLVKCIGGTCETPSTPPGPSPTPTPTVTPPTNSPTPTNTPTPSPTPTAGTILTCGQQGCPTKNCETGLVCAKEVDDNFGYCSLPNLVQQCILNPGYAGCCTIPSPTPTNTPTPTVTLTPSPTVTGTPPPTNTPTPTNIPTPTEIIIVLNTNTPAVNQPTSVPTIASVGTTPPLLFILAPIIIVLLGLFL